MFQKTFEHFVNISSRLFVFEAHQRNNIDCIEVRRFRVKIPVFLISRNSRQGSRNFNFC